MIVISRPAWVTEFQAILSKLSRSYLSLSLTPKLKFSSLYSSCTMACVARDYQTEFVVHNEVILDSGRALLFL